MKRLFLLFLSLFLLGGTTAVSASASEEAIRVYVEDGTRALSIENETVRVVEGEIYTVAVLDTFTSPVEQIVYHVGEASYLLARTFEAQVNGEGELVGPLDAAQTTGAVAHVQAPADRGRVETEIRITFTDGEEETIPLTLDVVEKGIVLQDRLGSLVPVADARIDLYAMQDGTWNQVEETVTQKDGTFFWYVPNGEYDLRVSHGEALPYRTGSFFVRDQIVHPALVIQAPAPSLRELWSSPAPWQEKIPHLISASATSLSLFVGQYQQSLFVDHLRTWGAVVYVVLLTIIVLILVYAFGMGGQATRANHWTWGIVLDSVLFLFGLLTVGLFLADPIGPSIGLLFLSFLIIFVATSVRVDASSAP